MQSTFLQQQSLLLHAQGLVLVNATSGLTTILANRVSPSSTKYPGAEIIFADDLDVASDGTVYFSTMTDIPLPRGASGHYEALPPCALNIMQVRCQTQLPHSLISIAQQAAVDGAGCQMYPCNKLMQKAHSFSYMHTRHAVEQTADTV